jgi:hypothetical protein
VCKVRKIGTGTSFRAEARMGRVLMWATGSGVTADEPIGRERPKDGAPTLPGPLTRVQPRLEEDIHDG